MAQFYPSGGGAEYADKIDFTPSSKCKKSIIIKLSDGIEIDVNRVFEERFANVNQNLKTAEEHNGPVGRLWDGFKNLTGIGDSAENVREILKHEKKLLDSLHYDSPTAKKMFADLTSTEMTSENIEKFIHGEIKLKSEIALEAYEKGQEMAVDITGDIVSGVAAVGIYTVAVAAVPFTGGASLAVGVVSAAAAGAAIKSGVKYADAKIAGREYDTLGRDLATGAFSGAIAPVTAGVGGAVGKTLAARLGVQAVKSAGKEAAGYTVKSGLKEVVKTSLANPSGYEYLGGTFLKRSSAAAAEMAVDGALGGSVDNAFRTAYDGGNFEDIAQASAEGAIGGLILSPVIGGGFKLAGKSADKLVTRYKGKVVKLSLRKELPADSKRLALKEELIRAKKINTEQKQINISQGKFAASLAIFDETTDAYVNLIKNNKNDIRAILNKYLNNEIDEETLSQNFYRLMTHKMGMKYVPSLEKVNDSKFAGSFLATDITTYYNTEGMSRVSELLSTILHETHHFLQQKEMFATLGIEEFSRHKALSDIKALKAENPLKYKNQAAFDEDVLKQTRAYIKEYKDAGWETVLAQYPKNTNVNSPHYKRAQKLIDADINYVDGTVNSGGYYRNLEELEAHDVSTKTLLELEYSVMGQISRDEYNKANEIYEIIKDLPECQELKNFFDANPWNLVEAVRANMSVNVTDPVDMIVNMSIE